MVPKFDPKELELRDTTVFGRPAKEYSYPLTKRQLFNELKKGEPWWMPYQLYGCNIFCPHIIPDVIARGFVYEVAFPEYASQDKKGGLDMFGIDWEWVEQVGGSMVRPGIPFMEDADEWYDKVVWPDVDSWDWEGCAKANENFLSDDNTNQIWFFSGYFERLISLMEFENALMAIFDEDYQEDVDAFFTKLTDLYIDIFDHIFKYFPKVNAVFFHDDWGSQKETFFSPALVEKMIVPHMKRLTDFLHEHDCFCELHSCGNNYKQVPNMIKAGWDLWAPQLMCDSNKIYDDFGDQITIATFPMNLPEDVMSKGSDEEKLAAFEAHPEEEQRAIAREFARRVNKPGKPSALNAYAFRYLTPAFLEELYIETRKIYSGD